MPTSPRSAGRPASGTGPLDRQRIVDEALSLMETEGPRFSWRSLARRLGVDPMALYRYFPTRDDLLVALAEVRLAPLWTWRVPEGGWRVGLTLLAEAYLDVVAGSPELTRQLARSGRASGSVALPFQALFDRVTEPLVWTADQRRSACGAWVDLIHGIALAGPLPVAHWGPSLGWLLDGFSSNQPPSRVAEV